MLVLECELVLGAYWCLVHLGAWCILAVGLLLGVPKSVVLQDYSRPRVLDYFSLLWSSKKRIKTNCFSTFALFGPTKPAHTGITIVAFNIFDYRPRRARKITPK